MMPKKASDLKIAHVFTKHLLWERSWCWKSICHENGRDV